MTYNLDSMSAVVTRLYGATPYAPESTRGPDGDWRDLGLCLSHPDPDLWYPSKGDSSRPAKRICNGDEKRGIPACPVKAECLLDAIEREDAHGIRGGLSATERRPLQRAHRRARNADHACDKCTASFNTPQGLGAHKGRAHKEEAA